MDINDTTSYHREEMESLGWELTVCNMLEEAQSPVQEVLKKPGTFGAILYDFISRRVPLQKFTGICEIGGGYGFIMRDFLAKKHFTSVAMIDISPFLLNEQRKRLKGTGARVTFLERDVLQVENDFFKNFELVLLNENIGDFPTLCDVTSEGIMAGSHSSSQLIREAARITEEYQLPLHEGPFHLNIGALLACEKLCRTAVPVIYMSEHSCEASVPEGLKAVVKISSAGRPERIALKGHDEYTIQFSYLEKIAEKHNYRIMRGPYGDILEVDFDDRVNFIMRSSSSKEDHEVIRHFIEDIYKYEYLLLVKQ